MIDGARRVGKSFLCEQFAQNEYKSYIIIDFGNAPKDILDLFETGSLIRLKKNVQDIIIPSEEEHIKMFPLDF